MSWYIFKSFISHWLQCEDEHSLHSPFLFDWYNQCVKSSRRSNKGFDIVENLRKRLYRNHTTIYFEELGAGSKVNRNTKRKVSEIVRYSSSSARFSRFIFEMIQYFQYQTILELGTSLGMNTAYMARANPDAQIITLEGDKSVTQIALNNFDHLSVKNIDLRLGNIDKTLPDTLLEVSQLDLVYFDANHNYIPTMDYFRQCLRFIHNNSVFIFDDIHWSKEMNNVWHDIIAHDSVTLTIDLFDAGVVFFRPELRKEHRTLSL